MKKTGYTENEKRINNELIDWVEKDVHKDSNGVTTSIDITNLHKRMCKLFDELVKNNQGN